MAQYTPEEFARHLSSAFASHRPKITHDVTDKGIEVIEFVLPHPHEPRFSICVQYQCNDEYINDCALWFGQAQISAHISHNLVIPAIEEMIGDNIVYIVRYKNQDAYDNHRPSGKTWLYQMTNDEDDESHLLDAMIQKITTPPTLPEKISGKMLGVFEEVRWSGSRVYNRV